MDPLERISYYQKFLTKNNELCKKYRFQDQELKMDINMILLSNKDLEDIRKEIANSTPNKANLLDAKLRKYYWDLVKLMGTLNDIDRKRIVLCIVKSNYPEHIILIILLLIMVNI